MITSNDHPAKAPPLLSICIPTYNRAACLDNCLKSVERATMLCRDKVEVIVSDNASSDMTESVALSYKSKMSVQYVRNEVNIGAELNFFAAAGRASAEHIWIFGDDDELGESAVTELLRYVGLGYDLILANFSSCSKDMSSVISDNVLSFTQAEYNDPNLILSTFGVLLGFVSSVVMRKKLLLSTPASEYEVFVQYGFPFPYCLYRGMQTGVRMAYIQTPLFRRREHNSIFTHDDALALWIKYFIEGPALIFEELGRRGYSAAAVRYAKSNNLKYYRVGNIAHGLQLLDRPAVRSLTYRYYRSSWRFWFVWLPLLLMPPRFVGTMVRKYRLARNSIKR